MITSDKTPFFILVATMGALVALSNWLVQFAINDWLTWAAFSYPLCFLVTDLANRFYGPKTARNLVYIGFVIGVILSVWLSTPRIAVASGSAFLVAQLSDVTVFHRLRQQSSWWIAPLISSWLASAIDTAIFFSAAFAATGLPWVTWAAGDLMVKLSVGIVALIPYRVVLQSLTPPQKNFKT